MADQILPEQPATPPTAEVKKPFDAPARAEISSFFEPPPAFDFVLPGMPASTVGAIISPGGAGKSMLALQVATAMAGAPDALELGLTTGKVLYLPAEDPTLAIWHRIHAMSKNWAAAAKVEVSKNLHIHPLIGRAMLSNSAAAKLIYFQCYKIHSIPHARFGLVYNEMHQRALSHRDRSTSLSCPMRPPSCLGSYL